VPTVIHSEIITCPVCSRPSEEHNDADVDTCAGKFRKREQGATGLKLQSSFLEANFNGEDADPVKRAQVHAQMLKRLCSCGKAFGEHSSDEMVACSRRSREGNA